MKKILVFVLMSAILFFALGYLYSSKLMLNKNFKEVSSDSLSRKFLERSSLFYLLHDKKEQQAQLLLESLIYGDLLIISELNFVDSQNSELYCRQLKKLKSVAIEGTSFAQQLESLVEKCE